MLLNYRQTSGTSPTYSTHDRQDDYSACRRCFTCSSSQYRRTAPLRPFQQQPRSLSAFTSAPTVPFTRALMPQFSASRGPSPPNHVDSFFSATPQTRNIPASRSPPSELMPFPSVPSGPRRVSDAYPDSHSCTFLPVDFGHKERD